MIVLSCALAVVAGAEPRSADDTARAKERFTQGQKLYRDGRYTEALAKFEEANRIKAHPSNSFNIGRCYEQLGLPAKALRAYLDYVTIAPDAPDRGEVIDIIANLERQLRQRGVQLFTVYTFPPGAQVDVDGAPLGRSPVSVELPAGPHRVAVRADGFEPAERSTTIDLARSVDLTITLSKETERATLTPKATERSPLEVPAPPPRKRVFTWVASGVSLVALGTGLTLAVLSGQQALQVRDGTVRSMVENDALIKSAQELAVGGTVGLVTAGAAAVAAVILFIFEGAGS